MASEQALGQVHYQYFHAILAFLHFHMRLDEVIGVVEGIFDVENAAVLREARQQVLGALPHKIPVQMREANQVGQRVGKGG